MYKKNNNHIFFKIAANRKKLTVKKFKFFKFDENYKKYASKSLKFINLNDLQNYFESTRDTFSNKITIFTIDVFIFFCKSK